MVKRKARTKYLFRTIKKNGVPFFAVAFIAATSIAIFLGLQSSATAILKETDRYFITNHLESLEITCANGITQEDIDAIAGWDEVDAAEGGYSAMALMNSESEKITIQARSLCSDMNEPVVIEGVLPTAPNETAVEEKFAKEHEIKLGDEITLEHDGMLASDTFRVTAIINEPFFCCATVRDARGKSSEGLGSASYYIMLTADAFDSSYYSDCYTTAFVKNNALDKYYYFSDKYKKQEEAFKEKLEILGKERALLRYDSLKGDADTEIEKARNEIADSEKELSDAESSIEENKDKLDKALGEIEANLTAMGLDTELDTALTQLELYGDAALPLKTSILDYQEGMAQVQDAEAELNDSREKLESAKTELADAIEKAEDIQLKDWIISVRNDVGDIRGVKTIVDGIYGLSYSMSIIFLLVAIVVCHAAISRMIDEQRTLIGAQKALGFSSREILNHYMLYNTLCAVLGILIGWLASVVIVEILVLHIFKPNFLLGSISLTFAWKEALVTAVICFAVFLTATYAACAKLVRMPATELLRGEVPVHGKRFFFEKWQSYKKLNLYSRTMIKNVLSDKGRMMTTIMGVVGCIALLVICFSLKLAIENSSVTQFDKYFLYDNRLVIDSSVGEKEDFENVLREEDISYTVIQDKLKNFRVNGGSWENAHIVAAPDFDKLGDFMVVWDINAKSLAAPPENGVLVSRKCAELYDLSEGSTVEFMDSEGNPKEFNVVGVMEHYLPYHLFVTTDSYYESAMGEETDESVFLLNGDISGLYERVRDMDGYLSLKDNSEYERSADSVNLVIMICLALSAVMALLVLLNQISMHINRKARELAVMRINGYTMSETKAYVYKDNIVLTLMGLILGSGFGIVLSYVVVRIIETGANRYVRTPNIPACLYACAVGALFALIVNLIALRKIKHLNLTNVSGN
ncbi:MAG: FtsX-like permease family protein [Oscillospiraceae bacterium]|nr:FtsX-like permease family protein [Oscillospiraceae bacterium]